MIEFLVGLIVALIGAFFYGKSQGKQDDIKEKVDSIEKAKDVDEKINKMDDTELRDTASKWVRNKDR